MDDPIKENINLSEMIELQFEHKSVCIFSDEYIHESHKLCNKHFFN